MTANPIRRVIIGLVIVGVVVGTIPGIAMADTGIGGTVTVAEDETVSDVTAVAGTVIIEGTVTGDVSVAAGNVIIDGTVEGDVNAGTGSLRIGGTIHGDLSVGAGSVTLEETGQIDGTVSIGAASVTIDGTIDGDATIGADTIRLGDDATIAGSLTYDGTLEGNTDAVAGDITRDRTVGPNIGPDLQPFASWIVAAYAFVLNLVIGAILLALFPRFSATVADRIAVSPIRTGAIGLGVLVGVPLVLVAIALTIIGIPLSLIGIILFALFVWIGVIYGRFAVGVWLLSLVDLSNRWLALVVGLGLAALLGQIPIVGSIVNVLILFLGVGGVTVGLSAISRSDGER